MNTTKLIVLYISWMSLLFFAHSQEENSTQTYKIIVDYFKPHCDYYLEKYEFKSEGNITMVDGKKFWNFNFTFQEEIYEEMLVSASFKLVHKKVPTGLNNFMVHLDVDQWFDEFWLKNCYNVDGELFKTLNQYLPQLFQDMRQQMRPPIEKLNAIRPGSYELTNFPIDNLTIKLDDDMSGRFKVFFYLVESHEVVFCLEIGVTLEQM